MSEKVRSVVLAFYSRDEGYAEQAFRSLQTASVEVQHFRAAGNSTGSTRGKGPDYSSLRLSDEELIVVDADPELVPVVVKTLRAAGEPAIFFARSGPPDADGPIGPASCNWKNVLVCLDGY